MVERVDNVTEETYFAAFDGSGTVHTGVLQPGQSVITGQPTLSANADAEEVATEAQAVITDLPDLPPEPEGTDLGEWLEQGSAYNWEGRAVIVVQSHNRQQFPPDLTPALFRFARTTAEWEIGVLYSVDDEVEYLGTMYRCLQPHTSIAGWEPPNVPALWTVIPD